MTDDLTTRLREIQGHQRPFHVFHGEVPAETIYGEAANRIEALEAELDDLTRKLIAASDSGIQHLRERNARDAVIAEALALHPRGSAFYPPAEGLVTTDDDHIADACIACQEPWPCRTVVALSRVPQGAAEPSTFDLQVAAGVEPSVPAAEPWTDPEPFIDRDGKRTRIVSERREGESGFTTHRLAERTRAQYDAEQVPTVPTGEDR